MTATRSSIPIPAGSVADLLAATAARLPHKPALVFPNIEVSYRELDESANRVAELIRDSLPADGDRRVAISLGLSPQTIAAYYGIQRAGAVLVPVNPLQPPMAVHRVLSETTPDLLLVDALLARQLPELAAGVPAVALSPQVAELTGLPQLPVAPGAQVKRTMSVDRATIGTIAFSSGTTGPSKAVAWSDRNVMANAVLMSHAHEIRENSVLLVHLPILSSMHTNAAVSVGGTQVFCLSAEIEVSAQLVAQHAVTHYYSQPVRLTRIARDPALRELKLPGVCYIASRSKALSTDAFVTLARRFGAAIFQGYGQTESSYLSHSDLPGSPTPGSVGPALAGTRSRIVDLESRAELKAGEVGEIEIAGPQLMVGYLNRPELEPFTADGWFRSGDVGLHDAEGKLHVLDRLVDVYRNTGRVVSPSHIERALESSPLVREAGVIAVPENDGYRLVAFVVSGAEPEALVSAVSQASASLEEHERVANLVLSTELPRMPVNGKIDRKALLSAWSDCAPIPLTS